GVDQAWIDEALGASTDAPAGASGSRSWFGIEIGSLGIVGLALGGILGGLVLNLTPCVLPVIPIKVMTLSQHAGENRMRAFSLGLWMAIGVVAFWVGIGLPVAFAAGFTDPSMIFGIWWVTAGIGVIIAAMGVGIMGAFQINLPQKVYMVNPKADSPQGSFVFGVMTAILGLPCFGFVAGALLAGAATMPTGQIMTVFASIGVGMASPYLVLSVFPKLLNFIPRTGPASELVKQIMGLLLLAAAAYFIGSGAIGLAGEIKGDVSLLPWWGKMLHWWAVAGFALAAGIWLVARTIKITPKAPARLGAAVLALIVSGSATAYVAGATIDARNNFWVPFSEESLADARADGKTVVIDFTAEWCLNCKALKKAVLNVDPVKSMLRSDDVVAMTADLTSSKAPGWQKMADLGQTGIPLLVIYGPGGEPWQSNAYTSDQVRSALAATGGETRVSAR
ncbi:MAG: cytochrome c biogenesis protein CcdA, partial [Planctomycetota bacterium]